MRAPRYSIIPAGAVTDRSLEPRDLQVLCLLGRHTDDAGWCRRSQVKMAGELSCGRATVQRALERLVEAGWVEHRPELRKDGGDTSHSYRVVIDRVDGRPAPLDAVDENVAEEPTEASGGVPTGGQGVPIDGQGVPALDGQGVPTHERAPIRTTPVERSPVERGERESVRERREDGPIDPAVVALAQRWPTGAADRLRDVERLWHALSEAEQRAAELRLDDFLAYCRSAKRKHPPALQTYIRDKAWLALPAAALARPGGAARVSLALLSRAWWWEFHRRQRVGDGLGVRAMLSLASANTGISVEQPPTLDQEAALVRLHRTSVEFGEWRRWFEGRGLRLPRVDVAEWVWMPSTLPPGAQVAAMAEEAIGGGER